MKLIITESQYKNLLLNEEQERLTKFRLNESNEMPIMGFSKFIGIGLTKTNKENGDKELSRIDVLSTIKDILEDDNKLKDMIKALEEKGMKNVSNKLSEDPHKLIDKYNGLISIKNKELKKGEKKLEMLGTQAYNNLNGLK